MKEAVLTSDAPIAGGWRDYFELSKPRIVMMIVITTIAGFCLASHRPFDFVALINTMIGTALVAGGSNALNQFTEREHDKKMLRTQHRPLPAGKVSERGALLAGATWTVAGIAYLALFVHRLPAALALLTLVTYLFIYTPMKRFTPFCTIVGAFPGAIPPVIGWTAARHQITLEAVLIFAILFVWQLPHFMAIGWIYREDYQRAGYQMLSARDPEGKRSARSAIGYTLLLIAVSALPTFYRIDGYVFLVGALVCGLGLLMAAIRFAQKRSDMNAKKLFLASNIYLPLVMLLLVIDRH